MISQTFNKLFKPSDVGYIVWQPNKTLKYKTVSDESVTSTLLQQHLQGEVSIGLYPNTKNNTCAWGAIDDDGHHNNGVVDHNKILKKLQFLEIPGVVAKSKTGGAHIYIFLDTYYPVDRVKKSLNKIKFALGYADDCEVFPKSSEDSRGNAINVPYFGNTRCFLDENGNELSLEKGLVYAQQFVTNLKDLQKYDLLKFKDSKQIRNSRTLPALVFLKKHYPDDWEQKGYAYNDLFNEPPLGKKEGKDSKKRFEIMLKNVEKNGDNYKGDDIEKKPKRIINMWNDARDMNELMQTKFEEVKFCVDKILPEGLNILAGKPKSMKSWTALDLCCAIENGVPFMGHSTSPGNCLYLGYEDNWRRVQNRLEKLDYKNKKLPKIFTMQEKLPNIKNGLIDSMQMWIEGSNIPKLIVIDTLGRAKQMDNSNKNIYDKDTEMLEPLQELAINNGITIQVVHHLKKEKTSYAFDAISGSTGIQGMSDSMWLLDRINNHEGKLTIRGRDILDYEYALHWDQENFRYKNIGDAYVILQDQSKDKIYNAIKSMGDVEFGLNDIFEELCITKNSKEGKAVSKALQRMKNDGRLQGGRGKYKQNIKENII